VCVCGSGVGGGEIHDISESVMSATNMYMYSAPYRA
jgi:hypothetical protein